MRMNQLKYVVEIAKCQSFSKASKKLLIAQPTLSSAVSALEEELGFPIFKRSPRGAFPTEEGFLVLAQAEHILAAVEQIGDITQNKMERYSISIAATPTACNGLITDLTKKLSIEHPEIHLNIIEARPQRLLTLLENGEADIVIGYYTDQQKDILKKAIDNNFSLESLMKDSLSAFVACNHPLAQKQSVSLHELKSERQAMFTEYFFIGENYEDIAKASSLDDCYTYTDRSSIKQTVAMGLAYAIFPHQMVLDDVFVNSGLIKALPLSDNNTEIITYLAWRKSSYTPKQETIVLDCLRELYKETAQRLETLRTVPRNKDMRSSVFRY